MKKLSAILLSALILTQSAYASEIVQNPIENNGYEITRIYDENRFVVRQKDSNEDYKYGVIDANGNIIIPIYKNFIDVKKSFFEVSTQVEYDEDTTLDAYYDYDGNKLTDGYFNYIFTSKDGIYFANGFDSYNRKLYSFETNSMVDLSSDIRIEGTMDGNVVYAVQNGKYGFLNYAGETVIPFEYDGYSRFHSSKVNYEVAALKKDDKWGIVDSKGDIVAPFEFDKIYDYSGEIIVTNKGNEYAAFDKNGNQIIEYSQAELKFTVDDDYADETNEDCIIAQNDDTASLYNLQGEEIVASGQYDKIWTSRLNGYFQVQKDGRFGLLNSSGEVVLPCEYDSIDAIDLKNERIYADNNGKGIALSMDNEIIFEFDDNFSYLLGDLIITRDISTVPYGYYHIYNENFKEIDFGNITNVYTTENEYNWILITADGKDGIIDGNGNIIIDFIYDQIDIDTVVNGYFIAKKNDKWGIIDLNQNTIVPFEYDKILYSSENYDILMLKDGQYSTIDDLYSYITISAKSSDNKILIDGQAIDVQAYNIYDNNYFKLRDIALMLQGTNKEFNVFWDENDNSINMHLNQDYVIVGGEMALSDNENRTAIRTISEIFADGSICYANSYNYTKINAYEINDNNYFKLRDLAYIIGFTVKYDEATGTVEIITE